MLKGKGTVKLNIWDGGVQVTVLGSEYIFSATEFFLLVFLPVYILICILVWKWAEKLGRSGLGWFVTTLFFTQLITVTFLLIIGKNPSQ